jgi:hypothetical protein
MLLADVQLSNDESKDNRFADIIKAVNTGEFNDLEFLITVGDNVSSFYRDRPGGESFDNYRAAKFMSILKEIEIPYYLALGNHDYKIHSDRDSDAPFSFNDIDTMEVLWKQLADVEPYFAFDHKGWNFITLNSMRGRYLKRFFDDDQMNFLEDELEKGKPSLLFFHHPIQTDNTPKAYLNKYDENDLITPGSEKRFFEIVKQHKDNIKGIFFGHAHMWLSDKLYGEIPVYMTDSFADNTNSPYRIIGIDTTDNTIEVSKSEFNK